MECLLPTPGNSVSVAENCINECSHLPVADRDTILVQFATIDLTPSTVRYGNSKSLNKGQLTQLRPLIKPNELFRQFTITRDAHVLQRLS